jgi:hypothetical protein
VNSKIYKRVLSLTAPMLACLGFLASAAPRLAAQGCAMCYQSAAASGTQGREVLRHGILVLLFPSLSLFFGIFALIYKRRDVDRLSR